MTSPRRLRSTINLSLDAYNFCAADIRDGLGPYLALFLTAQHWTPGTIGIALSTVSFASLISTAPIGHLLDNFPRRCLALAVMSLIVGIAVMGIYFAPEFYPVIGFQLAIGITSAGIGPGIARLSHLVAGTKNLTSRIGRNEVFNHFGNLAVALVCAGLANYYALGWVFVLTALMCAISVACLLQLARHEPVTNPATERVTATLPRLDGELALLIVVSFLYQFANASLLPIMTQIRTGDGTQFMSAGIVIAQCVSIPAAWLAARWINRFGVYSCLALGFATIFLRALAFANVSSLIGLEFAQILDGIAAGVVAVAPVLAVLKNEAHREQFGLLSGVIATAIGIGACASNFAAGYGYQWYGGTAYFAAVMAASGLGLLFIAGAKLKSTTHLRKE